MYGKRLVSSKLETITKLISKGIPYLSYLVLGPHDWVIEFKDVVMGNRGTDEEIYLVMEGRICSKDGLTSSFHDQRYLWSGDNFMECAWGNHGVCVATGAQPEDMPTIDCAGENNDVFLEPTECSGLCQIACNNNSYCDCSTLKCHCKAGFTGDNCSIDLCVAACCSNNGAYSARYLAFSLPVTSDKACICVNGWSDHLCNLNPCVDVTCSRHSTYITH